MVHQLFILIEHINNKIPKTGTSKPEKIENAHFHLSLNNPARSEVLAISKL